MKAFVDIPNYFWRTDDPDRADVRTAYVSLLSGLARLGCEIVARPYRPFAETVHRPDPAEGVYYAYHARDPGPHAYCIKGAALPDLWYMDPAGYSGWCELAVDPALQARSEGFDLARADRIIETYRTRFRTENLSRYTQPDRRPSSTEAEAYAVFYPLQVNDDEVLKLSRFAQFEVLEALAEIAGREQTRIAVKRHPLCRSDHVAQALAALEGHPFVSVVTGSVHDVIERSAVVVVANSGVGLQALIHGKPVFSLAGSEYAHMTTPLERLSDLSAVLAPAAAPQPERVRRQLGFLLSEYWVDSRDEEAVFRRVAAHAEAWRQASGAAEPSQPAEEKARSNLLAMERRAHDMVDHLLRLYTVSDVGRDEIADLLFRSYRLGVRSERILRLAGERSFLRRCLNHDLKQGDGVKAARALAASPDATADDLLLCGKALVNAPDIAESLTALRRASDHPDATAGIHVFLGRRLLSVQRKHGAEEALRRADRALALDPGLPVAHWLRARALLLLGRSQEAREAAERSANSAPENEEFAGLLARIDREISAGAI